MQINKADNYTILADDKGDFLGFANYLDGIVPRKYSEHNLVIDLLAFTELTLDDLLSLLRLSTYHRSTGHSFVIVSVGVDVDDIPMELVVVPTLQEAEDIIQMEEIERDLGF